MRLSIITVFFGPFTHFLHTYWSICTDFLQATSSDGGQGHIIMFLFKYKCKAVNLHVTLSTFFNTRELQVTYQIHVYCLSIGFMPKTVLKERKKNIGRF